MRLVFLLMLLVMAAGLFLFSEDMRRDRIREKEIETLEARIDAIQLTASGRILVEEYYGMPVLRPKVIKY